MARPDLIYSVVIESFGVRVRISSNSDDLLREALLPIHANLPGSLTIAGDESFEHNFEIVTDRDGDSLFKDGEVIDLNRDREHAVALLAAQVRVCVAEFAPDHVFIHSGVVAVNGRAVLFPATSMHGKSTLTAALIAKGAAYYSDEYAVIDRDGLVHPFPKDLSIREDPESRAQKDRPLSDFDGILGTEAVPAGLVLLTKYVKGSSWDPKPLTTGEAFMALVSHTVPIRRNTRFVMDALTKMLATARTIQTDRGEAAEAAERIIELAGN